MKKRKALNNKSKVKNILRADKTSKYKLDQIFKKLPLNELRFSVRELMNDATLSNVVKLNRKPNDANIYNYYVPDSSIEKSIYWSVGIFKNNLDKLQYFCDTEIRITNLILQEKFDLALTELNKLDEICGISIWSISLKATIYTELEKHSDIKDLYKSMTEDLYKHNMYAVICSQVMFKSYTDDAVIESRERLDKQLRNQFSDDLYYFLKYKILTFNPSEHYNFRHILDFEKNSTLIDLFICCCDFTTYSMLHPNETNTLLANEIVSGLSKQLKTSILYRISDCFNIEKEWDISPLDAELVENYTIGKYESCLDDVLSRKDNISFTSIEIASKSLCRLDLELDRNILSNLIINIKNFLIKQDNYNQSKNELYRQFTNFNSITFFKNLGLFLNYSERHNKTKFRKNLKSLSFVISEINTPFRADYISKDLVENYLDFTKTIKFNNTSALYELFKGTINNDNSQLAEISNNRVDSYYAKFLITEGQFDNAIILLNHLSKADDSLLKFESSSELIQCYNNITKYDKAIELFNQLVLECRNSIHTLDSLQIAQSAETLMKTTLSPSSIVALSLYSRFIENTKTPTLRAAFNKLLRQNNCTSPLELIDIPHLNWNKGEFVYFLNYVCTPEIMKFYIKFKSPSEIDKCRINICNHLILNNEFKNEKIEEVKGITKKLVLREATIQVAQSKVNADLTQLRSGKNETHIALYKKYQLLRKSYSTEFNKLLNVNKLIMGMQDSGLMVMHFDSTFDDINSIFIKLVKTIIEEFAFGEKGLNANVSTRIRHGHLPNTIRRSLLDEKLITSIPESTNVVKANDFWLSKLGPSSIKDDISKILSSFTRKIEDLIHVLNEEILQVTTLEENLTGLSKTKGALFSYTPTNDEIIFLQDKFDETASYTEFINVIESWIWEKTEDNLHNIRAYIEQKITPNLLSTLQSDLSKLKIDRSAFYEFSNAINRAKLSLNLDSKTILSWFKKREIGVTQTFEFETAVQISSKALLLQVELTSEDSIVIKGDKLSSFVDILYILYENSISKSGIDKSDIAPIHSVELNDTELIIKYKNNCAQFSSAEEENNKISSYIDSYGDETIMMERLHSEGGTGFAKIWKIISKDLNCKHTMNFGFIDDNCFSVEIRIEHKGLLANENTIS